MEVKVKVTDQEESWQWLLWLYFHGKSAHCTYSSMLNKNHQSFRWYEYSLENHCTEQKPMVLYEFWKIWVRHHFTYFFGLRVGNYGFILWHWGCEVNLMAVKTQELIELHFSWINYEIESTKFKESIKNILPRIINKFLQNYRFWQLQLQQPSKIWLQRITRQLPCLTLYRLATLLIPLVLVYI